MKHWTGKIDAFGTTQLLAFYALWQKRIKHSSSFLFGTKKVEMFGVRAGAAEAGVGWHTE